MKSLKMATALLLVESLSLSPMLEAMAQGTSPQEADAGQVIVISEKVGEVIDLQERNYYGLFLASWNFHSAVIRQLPDGSYLAEITEVTDGERKTRTLPVDQQTLEALRDHIENYGGPARIAIHQPPAPIVKKQPPSRQEYFRITPQRQDEIKEARAQAKKLAREKWTRQRWREESRHDRGLSYRTAGGVVGFTLGAAAGLLIGKGVQKREVQKVIHEIPGHYESRYVEGGEWGGGGYYEDVWVPTKYKTDFDISYRYKEAPVLGAAIGGIAGGITGYYLSKKADKDYYLLVPRDIRTQKTEPSNSSFLFGAAFVGPAVGAIAGYALATQKSYETSWGTSLKSNPDKGRFSWPLFLGGYLAGTTLGTIIMSSYQGRKKHRNLWQQSAQGPRCSPSFDVELLPIDETTLSFRPFRSPEGETTFEYRVAVLRARF